MPDDHVTRNEFREAMDPVREDIKEIAKAVKPIPALLTQVERINGTVAELNTWRYLFIGGGAVVAFIFGSGFITYILTEVLK